MIITTLIQLLIIGGLIAITCYVINVIAVELLKAPAIFSKLIWLIGLLVFIVYLITTVAPLIGVRIP